VRVVHDVHMARTHRREKVMNVTIDDTIEAVERLYTTLSGKRPSPSGPRVPIPPEADPVVHVQEQLDRMLSAVDWLAPRPAPSAPAWIPHAVAWVHETDLVCAIDVPGVVARDLQVRVEPGAIVVTGQRRPPWAQPPRNVAACDVPLGPFLRSFALANPIAPEQVSARLDDGVLTIRIHGGTHTKSETSNVAITL
jgi:HSP20 family protein